MVICMKNRRKFKMLPIWVMAFIVYMSDTAAAMGSELRTQENIGISAETDIALPAGPEAGPEESGLPMAEGEPVGPAEPEEGAEGSGQPPAEGGTVGPAEPGVGTEGSEQLPAEGGTVGPAEPEEGPEGSGQPPAEGDTVSPAEPEEGAEGSGQPPAEGGTVGPAEPGVGTEGSGLPPAGEGIVFPAESEAGTESSRQPTAEPDFASTAEEFQGWMEEHKNKGGLLKLTDNITLTGYQVFIPDGPGTPHILVDTDGHTITVTGEVEFWNDDHLTFRGGTENPEVFHVAEGGMLTLVDVSVENASAEGISAAIPYVIWQEEGACLIISGGRITGEIHYADTPFVIYESEVCVIVEKGQQAVLPTEIISDVNYRGQVRHREQIPVSWNLAGTEQQQEERLRFQVSGSYAGAAGRLPVCTVVYNDFPLTFTKVRASAGKNHFIIHIEYTKPEALLPVTIAAEYSFDGENWLLYEEKNVSSVNDIFSLGLMEDQWNIAAYPYLYLRLQCEKEGVRYFSNVLRYAADNLKEAVDQGGGRGGGTSIVNPSEKPEENPGSSNSDDAETPVTGPVGSGNGSPIKPAGSGNGNGLSEKPAGSDSSNGLSEKPAEPDSGTDLPVKPEDGAGGGSDIEAAGNRISSPTEAGNNPNNNSDADAGGAAANSRSDPAAESGINAVGMSSENLQRPGNRISESPRQSGNGTSESPQYPGNSVSESRRRPGSGISESLRQSENPQPEDVTSQNLRPAEDGLSETIVSGRINSAAAEPGIRSQAAEDSVFISGRYLVIAAGFVGAASFAGAMGFCCRAGMRRRLLRAIGKWFK